MRRNILIALMTVVLVVVGSIAFAGNAKNSLPPAPFKYSIASSISDEFNRLAMERIQTAAEGVSRSMIITSTMNDCFTHHGYSMDATARVAFEQRDPYFWAKLRKTGMDQLLMVVIQNMESPKARSFLLDNGFVTQETIDAYDAQCEWENTANL